MAGVIIYNVLNASMTSAGFAKEASLYILINISTDLYFVSLVLFIIVNFTYSL